MTEDAPVMYPDDLVAELTRRYGECHLSAFQSLARSRGLPVLEVLSLAVEDRLKQVIALPVVERQ